MIISKVLEIDMGHKIPNHKSKCRNPHGHRYKFEVIVEGHVIADSGRGTREPTNAEMATTATQGELFESGQYCDGFFSQVDRSKK